MAGEKDGKCDKWILHIGYQLPVMFSTFSLLAYIKYFQEKMSVNATDMTYPKSAPVLTKQPFYIFGFRLSCMASGYFYLYRNFIPTMIFSLKVLKMTSKFYSFLFFRM